MHFNLAPSAILLLIFLLAGCSKPLPAESKNPTLVPPKSRVSLTVEAKAVRGVYSRFGINAPENNTQEYVVELFVRNTGSTAVEWEETVTAFVPMDGPPLIHREVLNDNEQPGRKAQKQEALKFRLEPGHELVREVRSNGYTDSLIKDAIGAPLQLHIDFVSDGKSITPRFITDLPELPSLPMQFETPANSTPGEKLEFRRGPAKTEKPDIGYLET